MSEALHKAILKVPEEGWQSYGKAHAREIRECAEVSPTGGLFDASRLIDGFARPVSANRGKSVLGCQRLKSYSGRI